MRIAVVVLSVAIAVLLSLKPAAAERRVALVIGMSAYKFVTPLENPGNDARLVAATLRALGFDLIGDDAQLDLDKIALETAVLNFSRQIQGADVALFYYSGHGLQVRGENYLVPVAANPVREAEIDFQLMDANLVLRQMEQAGTKLNVVILDACRNNPFGSRSFRAVTRGLARMVAPEGTLISYATQPGNVALDGDDGNSPYTKALARTMRQPGLDIFQTFNEVGLTVMQATGNSQQPWLAASPIKGAFYFAGAPPSNVAVTEVFAWNIVKDSKDADQLRSFLQQFPNSQHRFEVERRVAHLEAQLKAAREEAEALRVKAEAGVRLEQRELTLLVQFELKRVGCFDGVVDGEFGETTRAALRNFAKNSATSVPDKLSLDITKTIRKFDKRICPLVCGKYQRIEGERCVEIKAATAAPETSQTPGTAKTGSAGGLGAATQLNHSCQSGDRAACLQLCNAGFTRACQKANQPIYRGGTQN